LPNESCDAYPVIVSDPGDVTQLIADLLKISAVRSVSGVMANV
jgi:hypothetical protein